MSTLGEAYLDVVADTSKVGSQVERDLKGPLGRAGTSLGVTLRNALAIGSAFVGVKAAVGFFKEAGKAATDFNETANVINVTFKDQASVINKFADQAAGKLGLSAQAALNAAGAFGAFGIQAGKAGPDLSSFSTGLVGLAADLASFNNTSLEDSVLALQTAFKGNFERLDNYNILLNATNVAQEALKLGLIKTVGQGLTPQAKVLATQSLLFKNAKLQSGDFARTSAQLANQQRILSAEFENVKVKAGQALLPVLLQLVGIVRAGLPIFQAFAKSLSGVLAAGLGLVARGLRAAGSFLKPFLDGFKGVKPTADEADGALFKFGVGARSAFDRVKELGTGFKGIYDLVVGGVFTPALANVFGINPASPAVEGIRDLRRNFLALGPFLVAQGPKLKAAAEAALEGIKEGAKQLKVDLGPAVKSLLKQVEESTQGIADALKDGLQKSDLKPLVTQLFKSLAKAITLGAVAAAELTVAIGALVRKIDWASIAVEVGKMAPAILLGLVIGLLNFDFGAVLRVLGDNLFEAILGVLTLAFLPAKILGPLFKILERIPFVGTLLSFLLRSLVRVSKGLVKGVGKLISEFGGGFLSGFATQFPRIIGFLRREGGTLTTRLGLIGLRLLEIARGIPGRLVGGLLRGLGALGGAAGRLVSTLLKPFTGLAGRLLRIGGDMIGGFIKGIGSRAGDIIRAIRESITDKLPAFVKKALNIESPSRVFAEIGKQLPAGLIVGINSGQASVDKALSRLTRLPNLAQGTGGAAATVRPGFAPGRENARAGIHIEHFHVTSGRGERAEQSVPRALRALAFQFGG